MNMSSPTYEGGDVVQLKRPLYVEHDQPNIFIIIEIDADGGHVAGLPVFIGYNTGANFKVEDIAKVVSDRELVTLADDEEANLVNLVPMWVSKIKQVLSMGGS